MVTSMKILKALEHLSWEGSQALFSGAQCQDQSPWAHTGTQEAPAEHQDTLFHWEGDEWKFPSRALHRFKGIQFM